MTTLDPWYAFRSQMVEALEADLMGTSADVVLEEAPLDRFVVGILFPSASSVMDEAPEDVEDATAAVGADAVWDPAVALSHMRYPSSAGMTFAVDPGRTHQIQIEVSAARYFQAPTASEDSHAGGVGWHRHAEAPGPFPVSTTASGTFTFPAAAGLDLRIVVRKPIDDVASITAVLVNRLPQPPAGERDGACWFQPTMTVSTVDGAFVARREVVPPPVDDSDLDSYALLYRDVADLAVGHGCSVEWDDAKKVTELRMTFLPRRDVLLAEPSGGGNITLRMEEFAESIEFGALEELVADYRTWIAECRTEIPGLPAEALRKTAERHMRDAETAAERIARGIDVLRTDAQASAAFKLMNRAMKLQRDRQDRQRGAEPGDQRWRPFQMAFILLNLEGLTDLSSPDRDLADVLWFPTGGGKTEAYLGLIAYAIALRRLRNQSDGGVSVIMRYTLRLLTVQQFERAAGLICALESLRKEILPNAAPISLGLWVGQGATPNSVSAARAGLRDLENGEKPSKGNPVQLLKCPACGAPLTYKDYKIFKGPDRMVVRCSDAGCEYGMGLPVHLIDDDVYRERPSLVIGTVDKFALMAWREQVSALFSRDGLNSPPDLIIQDELHLISGPLGTMVGLYEAAVDAACTGAARPKVVASTATIRRAAQQVRAVFDRDARQFPPPGLTASNSYFSVDASRDSKGSRQYVGVAAPATSHSTLLVRAYASLLQAAKDFPGDDAVRDPYWTLLGYFNSLRVLGGSYMQVLDDVPDRLKVVAARRGTQPREIGEPGELTSRKDSTEIPRELEILGTSYPDAEAPDVVLATNMISVGVDVDRLGLIAVMGQPQATAEYIQSTSRVGRKYPGLVVVLYNAARSRDLSHFEHFGSYHRALYRQVEATSATPFAARARDRGLHGALVSLIRLLIPAMSADTQASALPRNRQAVEAVVEGFLDRMSRIEPTEVENARNQIKQLLDHWEDAAVREDLKYPGWRSADGFLLQDASAVLGTQEPVFPVEEPAWATMTSLREVDASSSLYLVKPMKGDAR